MLLTSRSPDETFEFGRTIGTLLSAGSFLALHGDLGGGKTCFTRGIVASVAAQSAHLVASPTFAIMNEYPGTPTVYHFDFYRLSGSNEISELGFEDYFGGEGICIAEWGERLGELLPDDRLEIRFHYVDEDGRQLDIGATGPQSSELISRLRGLLQT